MNQTEFQQAITRMTKYSVGTSEAAALFAIKPEGSTAMELAEICQTDTGVMRTRLSQLESKGLLYRSERHQGTVRFTTSKRGRAIITNTLGTP